MTLMSFTWRSAGSSLSGRSCSDSAQSSFSENEMDIESSSSSWPKKTKSAMDGRGVNTDLSLGNKAIVESSGFTPNHPSHHLVTHHHLPHSEEEEEENEQQQQTERTLKSSYLILLYLIWSCITHNNEL
ncbi:hypothetical protein Q8A67_009586 [Cirrhinus molitorella]|uniref:Uncharacterized protein n=1 Tax=Cirrhinus molitorella TaxID=172907 RepID=A0AA88Q466_9TELE|nr:hypothetical protein Q8A67_009586 [Cirrhinus molitorella]